MKFIADLHIHSRFSRATSKSLNFESLYIAARKKGITVVGTGDFTHPGWLAEIKAKLVPAENGLFALKPEIARKCDGMAIVASPRPVRFLLATEISNIYKKNGRVRKVHHLVFFPTIEAVEKFNTTLSSIGNLNSDGRPILGLDSRDLLEIVLETSPGGYLVPAHIWTPWFSIFGSRSGFDSLEECFGDLSQYIFAAETGLSSDPPMNWRVSGLDGITLVSNSDAHSPQKLGREANLFDTDLSYDAIFDALKNSDPKNFSGTLEFYPEEGKYHFDGHRKCSIRLSPEETRKYNGICPKCGNPLTRGVMYRVEELADRPHGAKPKNAHPFMSIIPLAEIISEIVSAGPGTKKVLRIYDEVIAKIGPELVVLTDTPIQEIAKAGIALLPEAISRMREGKVYVQPGFDGEYGIVRVFSPEDRIRFTGQGELFEMHGPKNGWGKRKKTATEQYPPKQDGVHREKNKGIPRIQATLFPINEDEKKDPLTDGLDKDQYEAVMHGMGPLLVSAGPGTGKTGTLTRRIARLIRDGIALPGEVLAVTFTNKAAQEMQERLKSFLSGKKVPLCATFHSFCHQMLQAFYPGTIARIIDDVQRIQYVASAINKCGAKKSITPQKAMSAIIEAKQLMLTPSDDLEGVSAGINPKLLADIYGAYEKIAEGFMAVDYEDLINRVVARISDDPGFSKMIKSRVRHLFIDEYQDINYAQYRLIRAMGRHCKSICAIGDPDQSIYGFRGSDPGYFLHFPDNFPGTRVIRLKNCYRCPGNVVKAASALLNRQGKKSSIQDDTLSMTTNQIISKAAGREMEAPGPENTPHILRPVLSDGEKITILAAQTPRAEAVAIGKTIEQMTGGMGFDFHDFGRKGGAKEGNELGFSDFAVIFRTKAQGRLIHDILTSAGIPCIWAYKQEILSDPVASRVISGLRLICGTGLPADWLILANRHDLISEIFLSVSDMENIKPSVSPPDGCSEKSRLCENIRELFELIPKKESPEDLYDECKDLFEFIQAKTAPSACVSDLISDLAERMVKKNTPQTLKTSAILDAMKQRASNFGSDIKGFISSLSLDDDADFIDPRAQKVTLATIHAAKGLEFPVVFVTGCEDGILPLKNQNSGNIDMNEELRLFYVAVTRAKKMLFLTYSKTRTLHGKKRIMNISPFLKKIPPGLYIEKGNDNRTRKPKGPVQLELFDA